MKINIMKIIPINIWRIYRYLHYVRNATSFNDKEAIVFWIIIVGSELFVVLLHY